MTKAEREAGARGKRFAAAAVVSAAVVLAAGPGLGEEAVLPGVEGEAAEAGAGGEGAEAAEVDLTEILVALNAADAGERREAVRQLGVSGSPSAPARLTPILSDEDAEVRLEVALALGEIGGEEEVAALHVAATSDESDEVRESAWAALVSVGQRVGAGVVMPSIVETLQGHSRSPVRVQAAHALVRLGDDDALGPLAAAAATDPVQQVRVEARLAHDELRRQHDLPEGPGIDVRGAAVLDTERPPTEEEAPERRPGLPFIIAGGVLSGVGLVSAITGFALLPGSDEVLYSVALGLGIPGVLVTVVGATLLTLGLLRWFAPAPESRAYRLGPLASRHPDPWSARRLSVSGRW